MPRTYAELDQMRAVKQKNSPEFRNVGRNHKLVKRHYLQLKDGADGRYSPKYNVIHSDVARKLTINCGRTTYSKSPIVKRPDCATDEGSCSIEKRMRMTAMKKRYQDIQETVEMVASMEQRPSMS